MKSRSGIIIIFINIFLFASLRESANAEVKSKGYSKDPKTANTYIVPRRMIIVSPYICYIYANDLYTDALKDQSGFGGGLNIRTQIYKDFGFLLDALYTNLEVIQEETAVEEPREESNVAAIFTGGFYYSIFYYSIVDFRIDLEYGAITAGNNVMTIFVPGVEFFKQIFNRATLFLKLGYPITNDWIVDLNYEEHYTSFIVSGGFSVIF